MAYNENKPIKVWRYDISHGRWSHITDYPGYGAYQIGAISLNGIVYVGLGVSNGDFNTNDFWRFNEQLLLVIENALKDLIDNCQNQKQFQLQYLNTLTYHAR